MGSTYTLAWKGMLGLLQWTPAAQNVLPGKGTAARSHCIWRPWRGGVNPGTSGCVRSGTFWADPSLEAGESIWSKLYPACGGSWCESLGDCVGAAYLTPPSARQAWHRTVSNELMIWCETLWLRAEHRHHQWKGLHKQSRQVVINKYSMNYQMILQSFPCKATARSQELNCSTVPA